MTYTVLFKGNEPQFMSKGAAGADLIANDTYVIKPNQQAMIDTGTSVAIPEGSYGMLTPRSSLCNKGGLQMPNSIGIIDSDYRGSIKCCYKNTGDKTIEIEKGERICQLIIMGYNKANFVVTEDELPSTERGVGGFGSTDKT